MMQRVNLGCGTTTPPGWINVDGSWNALLSKYPRARSLLSFVRLVPKRQLHIQWNPNILIHDVRKRLPFSDDTIDVIYSSHMLEHLYLEEAKRLLKECHRVLKPGGIVRMVVPDLQSIVMEYVSRRTNGTAAAGSEQLNPGDQVNARLMLRSSQPPSGGWIYGTYSAVKDFHSHKWMYDADSLISHIRAAGFTEVSERQFQESRIDDIKNIEQASRVLNGEGICVEGTKPSP